MLTETDEKNKKNSYINCQLSSGSAHDPRAFVIPSAGYYGITYGIIVLRCAMPGAGYYGIAARGAGITVLRCAMPGAGYYGIAARDARRRALRMRNVKALHFQSTEEFRKDKKQSNNTKFQVTGTDKENGRRNR
jgi:hypothetical protein